MKRASKRTGHLSKVSSFSLQSLAHFVQALDYSVLVPVSILIVMVASMGLFVPDLGFYLDDWPNIFFDQVKGPESTHLFHAHDGRPLQGWYYVLLFKLFGTTAWAWQIYAFALRYLTVLVSWLTYRRIWPDKELQLGLAAILFAAYPIFAQQPIAITFAAHWTSFLCAALSTYLMVLAVDNPKKYLPLTAAAVALSSLGLILIEYFIGFEFVRLLLLWFIFSKRPAGQKGKLFKALLHFSPYLLIVGVFAVWRVFLIQLPVPDRNSLVLLNSFLSAPIQTIGELGQLFAQDLITMVFAGWYKTLQPDLFSIEGPIDLISLALGVCIAAALFFAFAKAPHQKTTLAKQNTWLEILITGLTIVVLGALPGWLIGGKQVSDFANSWSDRFGMASTPGAALIVIVILWKIATQYKARIVLFAVLVGLACGWHIRNSNDYRWSWETQQRIFSQMVWRMPHIEPDTLIVSFNEYFPKMGHYPTAFAINTLYPQTRTSEQVDYWYSPMARFADDNLGDYLNGVDVELGHWQAFFEGNTSDVIVANYEKDMLSCLWVLGPQDIAHPLIEEHTRAWLANSDLSRISRTPAQGYPKWDVIAEPPKSWCYFFQKADLAAQFRDWEEVIRLWDEARPYRGQMNANTELAPFIKGFIHTGNISEASELTLQMHRTIFSSEYYLCQIWEDALLQTELGFDDLAAANSILETFACAQLNPP